VQSWLSIVAQPIAARLAPKLPGSMKTPAAQASFLTDAAPTQTRDRDLVFDALAFSQAPTTANQLIELLGAAGHRTTRGAGFHNAELRRLLDELAERGLAARDERGRWSAARDAGWQRFRNLVQDDAQREGWWRAWRSRHHFDTTWRIEMFDSASVAGAMRVVIHCARNVETFNRLTTLIGPSPYAEVAVATRAMGRMPRSFRSR
jgi:hypothetical protein